MNHKTDFTKIISGIIDYLGVSRNDFARTLGYSRSQSIYDIASGKSRPSFDFFERFFKSEYASIFNPSWMFTGEGEMLKEAYLTEDDVIHHIQEDEANYCNGIPLIDETNISFFLENIDNTSVKKVLQLFERPYVKNNNTIIFELSDDSLLPDIEKGNYAMAIEHCLRSFNPLLITDAKYAIALEEEILFGELKNDTDEEYYLFWNHLYPNPQQLHKSLVRKLWLIKMGLINL